MTMYNPHHNTSHNTYPVIEALPAAAVSILESLVDKTRIVVDASLFQHPNVTLVHAFMRTLSDILAAKGQKVCVLEETYGSLTHLCTLNPHAPNLKAGKDWFEYMKNVHQLNIQPKMYFPSQPDRFVPPKQASLLQASQGILLDRSKDKPMVVISSDKKLCDWLTMFQASNTKKGSLDNGYGLPAFSFYVNRFGSISEYRSQVAVENPVPTFEQYLQARQAAAQQADQPAPRYAQPVQQQAYQQPAAPHGHQAHQPVHHYAQPGQQQAITPPIQQAQRSSLRLTSIPDNKFHEPLPCSPGTRVKGAGGAAYTLGQALGSGAEGAVYELKDNPGLCAKVFTRLSYRKLRKIQHMTSKKVQGAILPLEVLTDVNNVPVGYTMQRVEGISLARVLENSPTNWNRAEMVAAASALCTIHKNLAQEGMIPTDGNLENVLCCRDTNHNYRGSRVLLIDCDAFQVQLMSGEVLPGDGQHPTLLPPQLDVLTTDTIMHAEDHAYLLTEVAFLLCMGGVHPFLAANDDDDNPVQLSKDGLFPYSFGDIPATRAEAYAACETRFSLMPPAVQKLYVEQFSLNSTRRGKVTVDELCNAMKQYERSLMSRGVDPLLLSLEPEAA